jgi:hypothetical protein
MKRSDLSFATSSAQRPRRVASFLAPFQVASAWRAAAAIAVLVPLAAACSTSQSFGAGGKGADPNARPIIIEHEACAEKSSDAQKVDSNGDGKPDIVSVMKGGKEVCRVLDLNFDGVTDRYVYFDEAGQPRRMESDYDRDGRIDEVAYLTGGQFVRKDREMNLDGKLDTWDTYENGKLAKRERDADGDGRVDQWWTFPPDKPECPVVATDKDGDGRADVGSAMDMCATDEGPANILATNQPSATASAPAVPAPPVPPPPADSASSGAPAPSGVAPASSATEKAN